jgi:hypothetical protein
MPMKQKSPFARGGPAGGPATHGFCRELPLRTCCGEAVGRAAALSLERVAVARAKPSHFFPVKNEAMVVNCL